MIGEEIITAVIQVNGLGAMTGDERLFAAGLLEEVVGTANKIDKSK